MVPPSATRLPVKKWPEQDPINPHAARRLLSVSSWRCCCEQSWSLYKDLTNIPELHEQDPRVYWCWPETVLGSVARGQKCTFEQEKKNGRRTASKERWHTGSSSLEGGDLGVRSEPSWTAAQQYFFTAHSQRPRRKAPHKAHHWWQSPFLAGLDYIYADAVHQALPHPTWRNNTYARDPTNSK